MAKIRGKKGWLRVVEAFMAILLVAGVFILVISTSDFNRGDMTSKIYNSQTSMLRNIEVNNSLRNQIISTSGTVEWLDPSFPSSVKNKIIGDSPRSLDCEAKICDPHDLCLLTNVEDKNIYARSVIIASTLDEFKPKQLKLFCWNKN